MPLNARHTAFTLLAAALMASPAMAATAPTAHPASKQVVKKVAPAKKPAAQKAVYVCPMDPDVTSDKPGDCPKCGMHLEKKTK
ncbi:MAG TPA: heavy metal-binding domain-containing protein [Stenomitos sp.]